MRILIAVPTFETITPDTFQSLWDMDKPCECDFRFVRGYDCATARNRIADLAVEGGYDYVLMVDNDVTPPVDALTNLLSDDVEVTSGYYLRRHDLQTRTTCACRLADQDGKPYYNYSTESMYPADELATLRRDGQTLVRVHGVGMGCALVRTDTFGLLPYPWFDWVNYADRHGVLSEDLYFCSALKRADIPVYVDTRVACGHMLRHVETPD